MLFKEEKKVTNIVRLPVVFNLITIVAMLFSLFQVVAGDSGDSTSSAEAVQFLETLADEGVEVDESLISGLAADRDMRSRLANYLIATMVIAIVANVIANHLGRGRQTTNIARIRELEAELSGLRGH